MIELDACPDGMVKTTGAEYFLHQDKPVTIPEGHHHAVYTEEEFKILLIVMF